MHITRSAESDAFVNHALSRVGVVHRQTWVVVKIRVPFGVP